MQLFICCAFPCRDLLLSSFCRWTVYSQVPFYYLYNDVNYLSPNSYLLSFVNVQYCFLSELWCYYCEKSLFLCVSYRGNFHNAGSPAVLMLWLTTHTMTAKAVHLPSSWTTGKCIYFGGRSIKVMTAMSCSKFSLWHLIVTGCDRKPIYNGHLYMRVRNQGKSRE